MKERPDNQLSPQELLERDQKLLEALCIDYTAVYYCNLVYQKDQLTSWTRTKERAILRMAVVFGAIHEPRPTVL